MKTFFSSLSIYTFALRFHVFTIISETMNLLKLLIENTFPSNKTGCVLKTHVFCLVLDLKFLESPVARLLFLASNPLNLDGAN